MEGAGEYEKKRAEMLAGLGYCVFAADIYGKGVRPQTPQAAGAETGKFKNDRPLLRARVLAALEVLRNSDLADPKRLAAIGYCFGEPRFSNWPAAGPMSRGWLVSTVG